MKKKGNICSFVYLDSNNQERTFYFNGSTPKGKPKNNLIGVSSQSYRLLENFLKSVANANELKGIDRLTLQGEKAYFFFLLKYFLLKNIRVNSSAFYFDADVAVGWLDNVMATQVDSFIQILKLQSENSKFELFWPFQPFTCLLCSEGRATDFQKIVVPQIDVIVPTKGVSNKLLFECVSSILVAAQKTTFKFSLLVIDDNEQKMNLRPYLDTIIGIDTFFEVNVIDGDSTGIADARNLGVARSKSPIISFIDSDDFVSPDYFLSTIDPLLRFDNVAAVGTWLKTFGNDHRVIPQWENFFPLSAYSCLPPAGVLIWRREALNQLGGFDPAYKSGFEDFDLVSRATIRFFPIVIFPAPLYNYRRGHGSLSQNWSSEKENMLRLRIIEGFESMCQHGLVDLIKLIDTYGTKLSIHEPSLTTLKPQNRTALLGRARSFLRRYPKIHWLFRLLPISWKTYIADRVAER